MTVPNDAGAPIRSRAVALGLVPPAARLPDRMRTAPAAPGLSLVLAPAVSFGTARQRMAGCLAVHRVSPAFLPWPPRRAVLPRAALGRVRRAAPALAGALAEARQHVELVLSLPVEAPEPAARRPGAMPTSGASPDGRAWLSARAEARRAAECGREDARRWLSTLVQRLGARATPVEVTPCGLRISIRMARAPEARLAARVDAATAELGPLPDGAGRLLVTGPWPLFNFVSGGPA